MMEIQRKRWLSFTIIPIVLFYLCEFRFFYLLPLPNKLFAGSTNKNLLAVFSLFAFCYFLVRVKKFTWGQFGAVFLLIFALVAGSTALSAIEFGYKITQVLWGIIPYLILLLYFPAKKYLANEDIYEQFIVIGEVCTLFVSVLFVIQKIKYTGTDSVFLKLPDMIPDHYIWHPDEGIRVRNIFDGFFRVFALIIADRIIAKKFKKSLLDILAFVSILAMIALIDRSRQYLLIVLVSVFVIFLYRTGKKITAALFLVGTFAVVGGIAVISGKVLSIIESILGNSGSWFARVEGVTHYLSVGLEHFFIGIGMADPESLPAVAKYVRGAGGIYYPDDVGIVGLFALLGVVGVTLYVFVLVRAFKAFKTSDNKALILGVCVCFALSSILSSYFDRTRLTALVLTAVLCDINSKQRIRVYECDNID